MFATPGPLEYVVGAQSGALIGLGVWIGRLVQKVAEQGRRLNKLEGETNSSAAIVLGVVPRLNGNDRQIEEVKNDIRQVLAVLLDRRRGVK